MKAVEWLEVVKADLVTESPANKPVYEGVYTALCELLRTCPSAEIAPDKTVKGAYSALYAYASKNKSGNSSVVTPDKAREIFNSYLGITAPAAASAAAPAPVDFDSMLF